MSSPNRYRISNHCLNDQDQPVPFIASPNQSSPFAPTGIILHDTAGRLEKGSSVRWMQKTQAKASAHLVLERDGSLTQMVRFDRKAWHAGKSSYQGRENVNDFAIGIEIVNPGLCQKQEDGSFKPWFSQSFSGQDPALDFAYAKTEEHGAGWWLHYTKQQIDVLEELCLCLVRHYDLRFLTGHYAISPGRKIDPNPLFPMQHFQTMLFGRREKDRNRGWMRAPTSMRKWPSYKDNVILTVPEGAVFDIERQGFFDNGNGRELWYLANYASHQGWVSAKHSENLTQSQ